MLLRRRSRLPRKPYSDRKVSADRLAYHSISDRMAGGHVETVQHLPRVQQTSAATVKAKPQRRVALREQSTQGVPQLTSRPPDRRQGAKPTGNSILSFAPSTSANNPLKGKISSTRGQLGGKHFVA